MQKKTKGLLLVGVLITTLFYWGPTAAAKQKHNPVTTVEVVVKPRHAQALTNAVYDSVDPNSPTYHHYLSPNQVANDYGLTPKQVDQFKAYFRRYKLVPKVYSGHLVIHVRGRYTEIEKAFQARAASKAYYKKYQKSTRVSLPKRLSKLTAAIIGVKTPKKVAKADKIKTNLVKTKTKPDTDVSATTFSKRWGTQKYTSHYGVNSLYQQGLTGKGQRIGVITVEDFKPGDIKKYLIEDGGNTDVSRIHKYFVTDNQRTVEKANGHMSKDKLSAMFESALDVQQTAAVAPDAQIDAYVTASTNGATSNPALYYDALATAVSRNRDKQITTSLALGIEKYGVGNNESVTPRAMNHAFNILYLQAAIQGISIFQASGDDGPYVQGIPGFNAPIELSPYATLIGGTTLPYEKVINGRLVSVKQQRAWGDTYSLTSKELAIGDFPGSGGGFSRLNATPRYQQGFSGVNTFQAITALRWNPQIESLAKNPHPHYVSGKGNGRNYPDFSTNSDIQTGYAAYVTATNRKKQRVGGWLVGGGTSFAAPQAAAVSAIMSSGLKAPIGFWNPQIYRFAGQASSPFTVLDSRTNNNNLFFTGQTGKLYNQATGLGTVDFSQLYSRFKQPKNDN